ncbi:serine/threonine protein kinase [Candidatus Leptofilum sp.]|uniref:serine/threonine protein kinase n=1 Tax=Candidatus Leptofilum sp. TaxID=3241576 RepID=UPI003B5A1E39
MIPDKIGRYEIKQEIGRGGMATVYEAYDPRFERTVALKMLPREFMHEAEFRARFTREARTIATLEHPAIVPVYDFGEENGQPFLVMRLMTGGSLSDRLAEGPIPIDEAAVILKRLGSALDRAHGMGIIHRDLKPSNVLFDQYGDAFLADFGIVHVSSSTNALTASGSLVGTPTYMSPEQVYGDKQLDGRSDIYALGVILFQMLTGNTPYDADTPARMMMKHVMDPIPEILTVRPDLPPACNDIISKAMAKERDERFASATDLSTALTAVTERGLEKPTLDKLEDELTEMKAELMEETPPSVTPARTTAVPLDTATAMPDVPPPPPPATEAAGPVSFPTPPPATTQAQASGGGVPKWIWGVAAVVVLLCIGGSIAAFSLLSDDESGLFGEDPTNTPRPDEDEDEDVVDEEATAEAIAALETEEAESVPTATEIPTETAVPPTNTPTPEPREPTPDAVATRISAEATREAAVSATEAANPPPTPPRGSVSPIFGPVDDTIPHDDDEFLESLYAGASPANFVMRTEMVNPYGTGTGSWDFGLIFRQREVDDELRLVVRSDGLWTLNDRTPGANNILQEGDALSYLDLNSGGSNSFELIASGDVGYFFLNGEFVSQLDLSSRTNAGDMALGTGFYSSSEIDGETTDFNDFTLWPVAPVYGPTDGRLVHALDDLIKLEPANVDQVNYIVEATFTNPFAASVNDWDYGFALRSNGSFKYWLVVASEGNWQLADRQGSADDEETVAEGDLANLNLGANEKNRIRLIVWGSVGYFFVNDDFVATLNLSGNQDSGDVEAITAYYFDHEIEGEATGFENFTIIPLP